MAVSIPGGVIHPALLGQLADGRLHSGTWLARQLGVSRSAVRRGVQGLRASGIDVQAFARRGYSLSRSVELLDLQCIDAELTDIGRTRLGRLELLFEVDSTNSRLLAAAAAPRGRADVCFAELQRSGRGRRGRRWLAPFGAGIAMSASWTFDDGVRDLPALSLAVGVAVSRALLRAGATCLALKWPNDIMFQDRKIGGILIELRGGTGPAQVVIGLGLNVDLPPAARRTIEAAGVRVAAVADACAQLPSRNLLAGAILAELLSMLERFEREGFAAFRAAWSKLDGLRDRPVRVLIGESSIAGIARGVDQQGALLLDTEHGPQRFVSGEVSLRAIEGAS